MYQERSSDNFFSDALGQRVRFGELFDLYSQILTAKQRDVCERLLEDDVSLAEIGSQTGITRQGAHDLIKRTRAYLEELESALGLKRYIDERELILNAALAHIDELPRELRLVLAGIDDRFKERTDV